LRRIYKKPKLADRAGSADNLMGLAGAAALGEVLQAAQWWGAAERLREMLRLRLLLAEQVDHASDVAAARARCSEAAFEAAWRAGYALSADDVIAQAMTGRR
jgi:hypothetical protein